MVLMHPSRVYWSDLISLSYAFGSNPSFFFPPPFSSRSFISPGFFFYDHATIGVDDNDYIPFPLYLREWYQLWLLGDVKTEKAQLEREREWVGCGLLTVWICLCFCFCSHDVSFGRHRSKYVEAKDDNSAVVPAQGQLPQAQGVTRKYLFALLLFI